MMRPSKRARISSPAEIQRSIIPVGIATRSTTLRLQLEHVVNSWLRPSTCSDVTGLRRHLVFLIGPAHDDLQGAIGQRTLQRLRLVPRRAHPDIAFFLIGQDD